MKAFEVKKLMYNIDVANSVEMTIYAGVVEQIASIRFNKGELSCRYNDITHKIEFSAPNFGLEAKFNQLYSSNLYEHSMHLVIVIELRPKKYEKRVMAGEFEE